MSLCPIATRALKAIALVAASLGTLAATLTVAFLSTALSGRVDSSHTLTGLVSVISCVATLAATALAMKRLSWPWRAALGVLLLAGSALLLPRHDCGAEPHEQVSC